MLHKIISKQRNSNLCFVCGLENDFGIHAHFYVTENQELIALFTPSEKHQSYPERMHGGIASAILDETIGRAILNKYETEVWGVTVENSRMFEGTGEIILPNGDIAVTAHGKYLKVPIEKITDFDVDDVEWKIVELENDPNEIEI